MRKFARQGGKLRVFIRGYESDYTLGLSDDMQKEVEELGRRDQYMSGSFMPRSTWWIGKKR